MWLGGIVIGLMLLARYDGHLVGDHVLREAAVAEACLV
jgi:hypothetical protein